MTYSGGGDVTADGHGGRRQFPTGRHRGGHLDAGCEAADFAGFPAGNVALVQRGTCTFGVKAENAQAAGASAVVIFNEGQPGRTTLSRARSARRSTIPVVGITFALGR